MKHHHRQRPTTDPSTTSPAAFPVVGVGASAGGMEAFVELLRHIPHDSGMAFVLIQHLAPTHPSYLRDMIARSTSHPVHEIQDGVRVEPDHVYVIPPTPTSASSRERSRWCPAPPSRIDLTCRSTSSSQRWPPIGQTKIGES